MHHWSRAWSWCGQSERDESRTGPEPRCVGPGDGAGGSAVVGLDSDAGLNAAAVPRSLLRPNPRHQHLVVVLPVEQLSRYR